MPLPEPLTPATTRPSEPAQSIKSPHIGSTRQHVPQRVTGHPEVECGVGHWDKLLYGNHRFVVEVPDDGLGQNRRVVIPWRRQDQDPAGVEIIVVAAHSGTRVRNVIAEVATRESGTLVFQAVDGPGTYFVYYLPYAMLGKAHYPQAQYLPRRPAAAPDWAAAVVGSLWADSNGTRLPPAHAVRYEAASERDSFAPMNFTATAAELEQLQQEDAGEAFLIFAEDRLNPISMRHGLAAHWAINGPTGHFRGTAEPGEDYVVQLGVYALKDLDGVSVEVANGRCINTDGTDRLGKPLKKSLSIPAGTVKALFVIVPIPDDADGVVTAGITVRNDDGLTQHLAVALDLRERTEATNDPRLLRRLAWIDSTIAQDAGLVAPFTPVTLDEERRTLGILGRTLKLGDSGLPAQVTSTFTAGVTATDGPAVGLLAQAMTLETGTIDWAYGPIDYTVAGPARVSWSCQWTGLQGSKTVASLELTGTLDADGAVHFGLRLGAHGTVDVPDVGLRLGLHEAAVPLAMGLGIPGGRRPAELDWLWDVASKNQDALWLGGAHAGLQLALRDRSYERPLNTNFYLEKPLLQPDSWGTGGVSLRTQDGIVTVRATSGPRALDSGQALDFDFRLLLTPFKPIEPGKHLGKRYFHEPADPARIANAGATVVNIHHATAPAPYINDPLLSEDKLRSYIAECHKHGLKAKVYNTVRELTFHSPELLPMLHLDHEVFSDGPGKGHIWLQEHAGDGYVSAWFAPNVDDIAVVTTGGSRLENFYVRSLAELSKGEDGIDGIYLDDIAFDRHTMLRVRKVLERACRERATDGPEIDLHSANQFTAHDGYASSANLYMEQLPYVDRLWLGEYFDYEGTDPDYWLVELSGIPFGLMGEMLENGGNPWRGMVFGMTGRAPRVDNRPLWDFWAKTGLEQMEMVGHWDPQAPVTTSHADILATTWTDGGKAVVALASWSEETVDVQLNFDAGSAHLASVDMDAPAIDGFQNAAHYEPGATITIEPNRGLLLTIGY
ncbi:glycoside hydrolase domain-containing protein [Paenarthrobacter sp. NPDC089714]|uniref:glycoside hydrolase domain-containing protein n=1 Tax=Paenarthrobacter sp. NPDC089714 TaxID=3364377 RepID=UPI00381C005E